MSKVTRYQTNAALMAGLAASILYGLYLHLFSQVPVVLVGYAFLDLAVALVLVFIIWGVI